MAFTIKPNKQNMQRIKKNIEKAALKVEKAALDQWTAEGGPVAEERKAKVKKIVSIYRKHEQNPPQRHNGKLL